jgi:hypothetical protein
VRGRARARPPRSAAGGTPDAAARASGCAGKERPRPRILPLILVPNPLVPRALRLAGSILCLTAAIACAPPPPPAALPPPAAPPPPVPTATAAPAAPLPPVVHTRLDAVPPDAQFLLDFDATLLRATPLYAAAMAYPGAKSLHEILDKANAECGFSIPDAIDHVVIAGSELSEESWVFVAHHHDTEERAIACATSLVHESEPAMLDDRPALRVFGSMLVVGSGNAVLFGREEAIRGALARTEGRPHGVSPMVTDLLARPPALFTIMAVPQGQFADSVTSLGMTVQADASHLGINASIDANPEMTHMIAEQVRRSVIEGDAALQKLASLPAEAGELRKLLALLSVQEAGAHASLTFDLKTDGDAQAKLGGAVAAVAMALREKSLAEARMWDAGPQVEAIYSDIESYMMRQDGKGHRPKRFPSSAPRTPASIPKRVAVTPPASAWKSPAWKTIGFSMTGPTLFSYETVTSADGHTLTIRALADPAGNGKPSRYERVLLLTKSGNVQIQTWAKITDGSE